MKRLVSLLLAVAILLCLVACKKDAPVDEVPPDALPAETVTNPVATDSAEYAGEENEEPPPQLTVDEVDQEVATFVAMNFNMFTTIIEFPEVVPNDETTIQAIRKWMTDMNEKRLPVQFDASNLGMSDYGYQMNLRQPTDYYGSPICIWVQQTPSGLQVVVATAGPDGVYTYEGYGKDYTTTGFGDDIVKRADLL